MLFRSHDFDVVLLQRGLVDLGKDGVESVLIEHLFAIEVFDDFHRGLALAEAGDLDAALHLILSGLDAFLELFGFDDKAELNLVGRELFKSGGHG